MKYIKIFAIVALFFATVHPSFAQELNINKPINYKMIGTDFIGVDNGIHYFIYSTDIPSFPGVITGFKDNVIVSSEDLASHVITGNIGGIDDYCFLKNGNIYNIYVHWEAEKSSTLKVSVFDKTMKHIETKSLCSYPEPKISYFKKPKVEKLQQLSVASNYSRIAYRDGDEIKVFTVGSWEVERTIELSSKLVGVNMWITDNGEVVLLNPESSPASLMVFPKNSNSAKTINIELKSGTTWGQRFYKKTDGNYLLVMQHGIIKGDYIRYYANNTFTQSISVNEINLNNLSLKKSAEIVIDKNILDKYGKSNGLPNFKLLNIEDGEDGVYITGFKHVIKENPNSGTRTYLKDELFLFKLNNDNSTIQKAIVMKNVDSGVFTYYNKGKIITLFYENNNSVVVAKNGKLRKIIFDTNLTELSNEVIDTYEKAKLMFYLGKPVRVDSDYILFVGTKSKSSIILMELKY